MSLHPIINALNRPFWEGADAGVLKLPHCSVTGRAFWPPSPLSPFDEGAEMEWRDVAPTGVVRATCVYRRVFMPSFEPLTPFAIALVELDGGVRLQAHVSAPHALKAGDGAKLAFRVLVGGGPAVLTAEPAAP